MSVSDNDELVTALRRAVERMVEHDNGRDQDKTLTRIVEAAVETVPGAIGGGITRKDASSLRSSHATDDQSQRLDELQAELNEGPCVSAADEPPPSGIFVAHDLAGPDAERWPQFGPRAVELGVRSIMSVSLSVTRGLRSSLNFYSARPDVFDDQACLTAGLFGLQAATLLYGADQAAGLNRALQTRDVIGQAKGILMERFDITDDAAFQMLVTSSQETNVKLHDVAHWLVGERGQRERNADGAG
jgi:hypothetical protein